MNLYLLLSPPPPTKNSTIPIVKPKSTMESNNSKEALDTVVAALGEKEKRLISEIEQIRKTKKLLTKFLSI